MTTTRAAKYLAPIDIGKTITATDANTGKTVTGQLQSIDAIDYNIELGILAGKDSGEYRVNYDGEVTITGQPSPPTDNPHGSDQAEPAQPLPAPIPAAQAAGAACHCFNPAGHGHYDPACPEYCDRCNYQTHICPGCGTDLQHGQGACTDCKIMATGEWHPKLGISPGPACCIGDCCGPGTYCCTHPENNHAHPLDDDEPDHEHIATLQNPERCVHCGERLEYDENGNRK